MSGKEIEANELLLGDRISTFYLNGIFAGKITKITDKTIELNCKRKLKKDGMVLIKKFN